MQYPPDYSKHEINDPALLAKFDGLMQTEDF